MSSFAFRRGWRPSMGNAFVVIVGGAELSRAAGAAEVESVVERQPSTGAASPSSRAAPFWTILIWTKLFWTIRERLIHPPLPEGDQVHGSSNTHRPFFSK